MARVASAPITTLACVQHGHTNLDDAVFVERDRPMEKARFDTITRHFARKGSRRMALSLLAGSALLQLDPAASLAKNNRSRRRKRKQRRRKQNDNAGVPPASCYPSTSCLIGPGSDLERCNFLRSTGFRGADLRGSKLAKANLSQIDAMGADFQGADLGGACIVESSLFEAKLEGADLKGAIICNTIMPDGSFNTSGCAQATTCCPVCPTGDCPPQAGGICAPLGNACSLPFGNPCCANTSCTRPVPSKYFFLTICMSKSCDTTAQCASRFPNQDVVCEAAGLADCPQLVDKCCKTKPCVKNHDCSSGVCCGFLDIGTRCCAPGQTCTPIGCL
jgi:hypothetical protein